jgi:hypothetical protein
MFSPPAVIISSCKNIIVEYVTDQRLSKRQ